MKRICFYITMSLLTFESSALTTKASVKSPRCLLDNSAAICKTERLNLYVGPQSVEPGELLYIAVETANNQGGSGNSNNVVIVDTFSGREYLADVKHGLAHLEITAPIQAGRITFIARDHDIISNEAEVLVHAAIPDDFKLVLEKEKNQLFVSSSIITDKFGNMIEDGQAAQIVVSSRGALAEVFSTQLVSGRLNFRIKCSALPQSESSLSVNLRGVSTKINIPPYMCGGHSR